MPLVLAPHPLLLDPHLKCNLDSNLSNNFRNPKPPDPRNPKLPDPRNPNLPDLGNPQEMCPSQLLPLVPHLNNWANSDPPNNSSRPVPLPTFLVRSLGPRNRDPNNWAFLHNFNPNNLVDGSNPSEGHLPVRPDHAHQAP